MKLTEIFDKSNYQIITSTDDRVTAKAIIKDRQIDLRISEDEEGIWEFAFHENGSAQLTGSGGALEVFGTVKQFLKDFIEAHQPDQIFFSASTTRQGDFYSRLLKSKLKFDGYKNYVERHSSGGHFWIVRK